MKKELSYVLVMLAAFNITLVPAKAIEKPLGELPTSTNHPSDASNQIKNATEINQRRCIYISWAGIWWCFSWGDDD